MKNQANSSVNKLGLGPEDTKAVKAYASNLLHPTKGIDIPRPFPVKSYKGFYSGQLVVDSEFRDISFQVKPDPFKFIRITESTTTAVPGAPLPIVNFAEGGADDVNNGTPPGIVNILFSYPLDAPLSNGTVLPTHARSVVSGTGILAGATTVALENDNFRYRTVMGWENATISFSIPYAFYFKNNSAATVTISPILFTRSAAGVINPLSNVTPYLVTPGQALTNSFTLLTTTVTGAGNLLCFGFRLTEVANTTFNWENCEFGFTNLLIGGIAGHSAQRTLTLGEAAYPGDPVNAERLTGLFENCQLYAPVACSSVLNVTQLLKDRGGNFLSAYLPSRVTLPPDTQTAWEVAKTYGRSYPVSTNPFAKGAHASWVGTRIQDYEFRRPFQESAWQDLNYDSLPSTYLLAQRAVSSDAATATYYLDFSVAFSIQTLDPTITLTMSPSCPNFLHLFLALVSMHPLLVGENPDHLKRVLELAKMVANDPRVAQLVKFGFMKGLPLLMGALA